MEGKLKAGAEIAPQQMDQTTELQRTTSRSDVASIVPALGQHSERRCEDLPSYYQETVGEFGSISPNRAIAPCAELYSKSQTSPTAEPGALELDLSLIDPGVQ